MTDRRTPHIAAIDGLRAIAVVAVMLFHVRPAWLPGGYVGVDIFFVISGFVVTGSIIDRRFTSIGGLLAFFYARRLLRIMPALVVMLLVTALLSDMFIPDAWLSQSASGVGKAAFLGISNIKLAMGDNEYFSPAAAFDPFLHTWSLGVEEQFYLIFPLIMYWRQRRISGGQHERPTLLVIAALSLLSLGLCAWLTGASWRYAFYSLPSRFWELGLGMSLRVSAPAWTPRLSHTSWLRATLLTTAVAAVMLWSFATAETRPFPFPLALLPAGGTAMALALVWGRPAGLLSTALSGRAMAYLGLRSYSLYLWHWPVIVLLRWTIGIERPWQMALALALTMAIGSLSYRFIELPTHRNPFVLRQRPGHVVAGALFALGLSTAAGLALFAAKPALSLSDTAQTSLWYADERKPLWIGDAACDTRSSKATLDRGEVTTWSPSGCGTAVRHGRIFVVGDSHSLVYFPAFRQFAAQTGTIVRSYYATGCGLFRLDSPMSDHPECAAYYRGVIDQLRAEARPGDILFLPSLRLDRLGDQWGREEEASTQAGPGPSASTERRRALIEADEVLRQLRDRGARIIFEAPTPLFPSPPFRCADWFNARNPICSAGLTTSRARLDILRAPVLSAMRSIATRVPGTSIWDPLPILCPTSTCSAIIGGRPLFFDGDHLSGYGNEILYPSFSSRMSDALGIKSDVG